MDQTLPETSSHPGELPEELLPAARSLIKALADNHAVQHAFADFCAKAYVKPDWAGAASEFIVDQFEGREPELASMARIPDLIIELASGHQTLTTTVAFQWASSSDSARMVKLAEALAATQSKIQSTEVVHLMLALATSLSITRYTRAEQMLTLAEPQAQEEHQESLAEARLWLAAGRTLCGCTQDTRDLFDHRLRRRRTAWTWDGTVEKAALQELADHLHPEQEGSALYRAIVPPVWWAEASRQATERDRVEDQPPVTEEATQPTPPAPPIHETSTMKSMFPPEPPQGIDWNIWQFFMGGLVGATALSLVIWWSPLELKRVPPEPTDFEATTLNADDPPPPQETWRKEEIARVAAEHADLQDLYSRIRSSPWADVADLLSGTTADLPKDAASYRHLLTWLHLDPPEDEEIRKRLPALLAAAQPDSVTLDLWEKLAYKGSPIEAAIRNSARRQLYDNRAAWSASQQERLNGLGFPPSP